MNKKKPIFTLNDCHAPNSWLLSTAAVKSSDLMVSGGYDGNLNWYKFNNATKSIVKTNTMSGFDGCINSLKFSNTKGMQTFGQNSVMLAVSHS